MMNSDKLNKTAEAFWVLLRAGLWRKRPDIIRFFPLTAEEWNEVFSIARKQTVTAIVYDGVSLLPEEFLPPQNLLLKWVAAVDTIERLNVKMNKCLCELYELFLQNRLEPVLQKGQGVAALYENPLSRECGDIDLYFASKVDMQKAIDIVQKMGCRVSTMPDGSYNFLFRNTEVEIHPFIVDISNPFKKVDISRMERAFGYIRMSTKYCETKISVPSPFINILLLNTHILKHVLGWGIGIRQLCDMARACYSLHGFYDKTEMNDCCCRLGIKKWTLLLNAFMVDYLGLDNVYMPLSERGESALYLKNRIMQSGNFGMNLEGRNSERKSKLKSKADTMRSLCGNMNFALRYAPAEGFWTFFGLLKGQF